MAKWFSKDTFCPDNTKQQWKECEIYGLTDVWEEASI